MSYLDIPTEDITQLADTYGLDLLVLFGSQVTGNVNAMSDVDIAYLSHRKLTFNEETMLLTEFYPLFKREDIDLVNMRTVSPVMGLCIAREGKLLFATDERFFEEYKLYAFKRYVETKPLRDMQKESIQKKIEEYDTT